jgi:hypothetical protein
MFRYRTLALASVMFATASLAHGADTHAFSVLINGHDGQPVVFQSTDVLKKGDVITVQGINAHPVLVLEVAMCDAGCKNIRLFKTVPLLDESTRFVVPEDGRVSFWVQQPGDPLGIPILHWSEGFAYLSAPLSPFLLSYATTPKLYSDTAPMPAESVKLDDGTLIARYNHHIFVNVSLADVDE